MAQQLYSLFRQIPGPRPRYERVAGAGAYPRAAAVRIFQDRLINSAFSSEPLSLRPVKAEPSKLPASENVCGPCAAHIHTRCAGDWCNCNCRMLNGR